MTPKRSARPPGDRVGRRQGDGTRCHHQARADQRDARAVNVKAWYAADRQGKIACHENACGSDATGSVIVARHEPWSQRSGHGEDEQNNDYLPAYPMGDRALAVSRSGGLAAFPIILGLRSGALRQAGA